MYPVGHAAFVSRMDSFKKLEDKIKDSPRRLSLRTRIGEHIARARREGKFTAHFEQPVIPNAMPDEQEEILSDLFTYYTQQGYYIESRAYFDKQLQLIKEGIFIAWDRALPSQSMMIPK